MASVVCQGLQSCLEPRLIEPLILRHKLSPPNPTQEMPKLTQELDSSDEEFYDNKKGNGGWSILQALTNPNHKNNNNVKTDEVYVHPMVKRSVSALSTKSLEMCTESLGSETGSDISNDELPPISWEESERLRAIQKRAFACNKASGRSCTRSFPPPLTSISGLEGVKVKPHREGGRLVIKAVTVISSSTCFKAERTNGRLRLSLMKEESPVLNCDEEMINGEEKVVHENDDDGRDELHDDGDDDDEMEGDDEEEEWGWDMEGNYAKGGGEGNRRFDEKANKVQGRWEWEQRVNQLGFILGGNFLNYPSLPQPKMAIS